MRPAAELTPFELRHLQDIIDHTAHETEMRQAADHLHALAEAHAAVSFVSVQDPFGVVFGFRFDKDYNVASAHLRLVADAVLRLLAAPRQ
jgi:hypothetical protein